LSVKRLLPLLQLLAGLTLATPVSASLLDSVAASGVLVGGTSRDAFPFAYQNESGELVGYSIDMMNLIREEIERQTGRPITLKLVPLETDQRLPSLVSGAVNLVCDASSFTWSRDETVDFSVSYGITGTQLLVPRDSGLSSPESLAGKRVGALPRTTSVLAVGRRQPAASVVLLKDRQAGYDALEAGRIDAFADDGMLLYAWLQRQGGQTPFKVSADTYSREGIACMLPQNNSAFQRVVDLALIRFMQGFLRQQPREKGIFDRWFGPQGKTPLTQDVTGLFTETMQLMVDFKEELPTSP
jgi:polar amino acid transport system substrate-binding protein